MAILQIKGQTQGSGTVTFTIPTTDEHSTVTLPAKTGTLALTSDIVETDISSLATKSELTTGLAKKAEKVHTHTDAQITGLSDKLSAKLDITTYTSDKSTFALKTTVEGELAKKATTEWVTAQLGTKLDSSDAFTQTDADKLYLGKSAKAASATLADKATVLNTARTIAIGGAVTGTATSFNGSSNITINTTTVNGANVTGTVPAATKATQDSAGQQINTTYIKDLSVSGKVVTFTKGDGSTGTITTQDTTYTNMVGATSNVAGKAGLVTAPSAGAQGKYLRGDGTWQTPPNTDTKVSQTVSTTAGEYPILTKDSTAATTVTTGTKFASAITANHSTGVITAKGFKGSLTGNASTATKATQDSAGQQINTTYIKDLSVSGKVVTFTKGDGSTGTITTQDTTYTNMVGATSNVAGKAGLVTAPSAGAQGKYLRGDGTWQTPPNTDTKVSQTVSTTAGEYPILTKDSTAATTVTTGTKFASAITANHSTGVITAKGFKGSLTGNASTATKATQDASGNVITTTYATKTEMNAKAPLANPTFTGTVTISGSGTFKGNLTGTADTAKSASAVAWANVSGKPGLIPTRGNAGTITTSETIANLQTVNASSPRSMKASSGATVTLQHGGAEAWITVVACEGAVTVNLGNGWAWSGSTPTFGKGLITCAWYGSFGIVNFMKWGS